ncbi:MAG: glycogen debranching enzyme N-terminal domain-containing protein [Deferrisomatales bacterium]
MRDAAGPGGGLERGVEIAFGREVCGRLEEAERREWWLADGLGGYAAGTVAGTLTRRYHGLLIAPVDPPLGRRLLAAKADAVLLVDQGDGEQEWALHTNRWAGGSVNPQGFLHLESFRLERRTPVWRYALGGFRVEARIWMEKGAHATWLAWRLAEPAPAVRRARLLVRILVNDRDHHGEAAPEPGAPEADREGPGLRIRLGTQALRVIPLGGTVEPCRDWIEGFDLPAERERGLPHRDNHLCAGIAALDLTPGFGPGWPCAWTRRRARPWRKPWRGAGQPTQTWWRGRSAPCPRWRKPRNGCSGWSWPPTVSSSSGRERPRGSRQGSR